MPCCQVAFVERLGIQKSTLARVVNTCPKLFSASLEGQWEPTLKYMELLGIRREEWGVMIAQHPTILTLNFATDILPKVCLTRRFFGFLFYFIFVCFCFCFFGFFFQIAEYHFRFGILVVRSDCKCFWFYLCTHYLFE